MEVSSTRVETTDPFLARAVAMAGDRLPCIAASFVLLIGHSWNRRELVAKFRAATLERDPHVRRLARGER